MKKIKLKKYCIVLIYVIELSLILEGVERTTILYNRTNDGVAKIRCKPKKTHEKQHFKFFKNW